MKMYYTDPLKAAWMAREFGVKFKIHGEVDLCLAVTNNPFISEPFYIHPDSYSIFEPVEGDLSNLGYEFDRGDWRNYVYDASECETYEEVDSYGNNKTIQRNNKAFFMPEGEQENE